MSYTLPHAELVVPNPNLQSYLNPDGLSKFAPEKAHPAGQHYGPQVYPKAAYAAMVSQMDEYVGQIVAYLKEKNYTIIQSLFSPVIMVHIRKEVEQIKTFISLIVVVD